MATVTFDTYAFVKRLKDAGFSDKQAEALALIFNKRSAAMRDSTKSAAILSKIVFDI